MSDKEYVSLAEASKLSSYSEPHLRLLARQGKLQAVKFGRNWVTKTAWLEEFVSNGNNNRKRVVKEEPKTEEPKTAPPPEHLIFVLTGALETMTREAAKEKICELGGSVSDTVSKKTDYVIVGKEPGSKLDKVKKLGVKIIDEKEFIKIIKWPHF